MRADARALIGLAMRRSRPPKIEQIFHLGWPILRPRLRGPTTEAPKHITTRTKEIHAGD
jgi:hypothetical protein